MGVLWSSLSSLFFSKKLEVVLVGLQNSGKSTFCNCLELGKSMDTVPTVGMQLTLLERQGVRFKVWDVSGQSKCREEWARYCKGCDVIVFVVDSNDVERLPEARIELHRLLEDHELAGIPLLVLANKVDIARIKQEDLIKALNLDYCIDNSWVIVALSAKNGDNVDKAVDYLIRQSKTT